MRSHEVSEVTHGFFRHALQHLTRHVPVVENVPRFRQYCTQHKISLNDEGRIRPKPPRARKKTHVAVFVER